jgi:hypothetical protein
MSKAGTPSTAGRNKRNTGERKTVRFRRYRVPLVRPVRVVADKIETDPKLMSSGMECHIEYNGEKYYVKKYDDNIFGLGSAKEIMTTVSQTGEAVIRKRKEKRNS